jgi:predicted Zn-dependent protease with MMP-like domain
MRRARFVRLVEEALDALPIDFRERIDNVAILVKDRPKVHTVRALAVKRSPHKPQHLLLGIFQGIPATQRSVFDISAGPNRIILYQKNIEAICSSAAEVRREVRQTVLHELGHYFGMNEDELKNV